MRRRLLSGNHINLILESSEQNIPAYGGTVSLNAYISQKLNNELIKLPADATLIIENVDWVHSVDTLLNLPAGFASTSPDTISFDINIVPGETIYIYGSAGLRYYQITYPADNKTWNFSSSDWSSLVKQIANAGDSGLSDVDATINDLRVYSGGKSIRANTSGYIQLTNAGSPDSLCFQYIPQSSGTLNIKVSNTGGTANMERLVYVQIGDSKHVISIDTRGKITGEIRTCSIIAEYEGLTSNPVIITQAENIMLSESELLDGYDIYDSRVTKLTWFNSYPWTESGLVMQRTYNNYSSLESETKLTYPENLKFFDTGDGSDWVHTLEDKEILKLSNPAGYATSSPQTVVFEFYDTRSTGLVYIYGSAGLRFYSIRSSSDSSDKADGIYYDRTWDFSSSDWKDYLSTVADTGSTGVTDLDIAVKGLRVVSGGGTVRAGNNYWQLQTPGDIEKCCFVVAVPKGGRLEIKVSNTGSNEDLDRLVYAHIVQNHSFIECDDNSTDSERSCEVGIDNGALTITQQPAPLYNARGFEYVDMGDAGIWATCNVGASKPEDYGLYFAWGETQGYASASEKSGGFEYKTTPYWVSGSEYYNLKWSKYTKHDEHSSTGIADNKLVLDLEDDAAHVNMGGDWRMPTREETAKLWDACDIDMSSQNGVAGVLFTLKTDSTKTLFFPYTGHANGSSMERRSAIKCWTSSLYSGYEAYGTYYESGVKAISPEFRRYGLTIRAILGPSKES